MSIVGTIHEVAAEYGFSLVRIDMGSEYESNVAVMTFSDGRGCVDVPFLVSNLEEDVKRFFMLHKAR